MEASIRFKNTCSRLHGSLLSAIDSFRSGNDSCGLENFLNCMEELDILLTPQLFFRIPQAMAGRLVPLIQTLRMHMENQDITGMTDLLEFELYPLAKGLIGEEG